MKVVSFIFKNFTVTFFIIKLQSSKLYAISVPKPNNYTRWIFKTRSRYTVISFSILKIKSTRLQLSNKISNYYETEQAQGC